MGRLLREYHDAVSDWNPRQELVWADGTTGTGGPDELVCHGDFGPWNIVWQGNRTVGLLDWEYANPARPVQDVAWALQFVAPFRDDQTAVNLMGFPEPPPTRAPGDVRRGLRAPHGRWPCR
jgi:aminoglycoside phosphotransferase (APT) family kinase protein